MAYRKVYEMCPYIVGNWPKQKPCGKPVKICRSAGPWCHEHAARMPIWPTADPADRPVALLANPEPRAFAHVERYWHDHT